MHGSSAEVVEKYDIHHSQWEKTLSNCMLLKQEGIPFGVKMVVSRLNYKDIYDSVETFNELGARTITLLHLLPVGGGSTMEDMAKFSPEEVQEIVRAIRASKRAYPNVHIDYRPFLNIYFPKEPRTKLDELINCPAGRLDLRIRYDGKVLQCSSMRIPLDDITKNTLQDIWGSIVAKMSPCPYNCSDTFSCIQHH